MEELAARLARRGNEVYVYVRNNYTAKEMRAYRGITLIHLPSIPTKNLDAITHTFLATLHVLFCRYDIVHYQAIGPASLSWIVKILKPRTVVVATYHCKDYFHQKWSTFAKVYLKIGEYVTCTIPDRTIAVSHVLGEFIMDKFKREASVIPNGFHVSQTGNDDLLKEWGLKKDGYILSVSRLIRHKGIHYLINAYKKLDEEKLTGGKKLVIVGEGSYTDDYVKELENISASNPNIIFTGARTGEALRQLFSHAYLFVQPSESEGLSIALLEAMGYGKAVLVSNIPENMEVIAQTGFCFQSGDVKDLAGKLGDLIQNEGMVRREGIKGKEEVEERYNWENIASSTEAVYQDVLKHKVAHYAREAVK